MCIDVVGIGGVLDDVVGGIICGVGNVAVYIDIFVDLVIFVVERDPVGVGGHCTVVVEIGIFAEVGGVVVVADECRRIVG